MDYEFAAFFSYKRDPESDFWHKRLKEKLEHQLRLRGLSQCKIFFDAVDIHAGEDWEHRLADALKKSRCIVCVWSPAYFNSNWCRSELQTFEQREEKTGLNLIVPASYQDGSDFPESAKKKQFRDFTKYTSSAAVFWESLRFADEFEPMIRDFADVLATQVRKAPPFDEQFPSPPIPVREDPPEPTVGRPSAT